MVGNGNPKNRPPAVADVAGMTAGERALLFVETVFTLIDSLPVPESANDFAVAPTLPGVVITTTDVRAALDLLTTEQKTDIANVWVHFIAQCSRTTATRHELRVAFSPVAHGLGVDLEDLPFAVSRSDGALHRFGVDENGQFTLDGEPTSRTRVAEAVLAEQARDVADHIARGRQSVFDESVLEAVAERVEHVIADKAEASLDSIVRRQQRATWFAFGIAAAALVTASLTGAWAYKVERLNDERLQPTYERRVLPVIAGQPVSFEVQAATPDGIRWWGYFNEPPPGSVTPIILTRDEIARGTRFVVQNPTTLETLTFTIEP